MNNNVLIYEIVNFLHIILSNENKNIYLLHCIKHTHYCSYFCIPENPRMTKIDYDYLSIPYKNKKTFFKGLLGHCRGKKRSPLDSLAT